MLNVKSGIGISHGWEVINGPFKITEGDRNVIKTIDWKPAFELYRKEIKKHSDIEITPENFFDVAKSYPFGISRLNAENLVRDPFMVLEDGSIVCVGEVPVETYLHILTGNVSSLVDAARKALTLARDNYPGDHIGKVTFFIDCISRVLFMQERFKEEIEAVFDRRSPLIGALTIGEIANSGKDYLEFYNKTSVAGVLDI